VGYFQERAIYFGIALELSLEGGRKRIAQENESRKVVKSAIKVLCRLSQAIQLPKLAFPTRPTQPNISTQFHRPSQC